MQTSSVLLLSGSLRLHSSSSSSDTGRPGDSKPGSSRRGLFRGRSQRNEAAAAAAGGGMTLGQHGIGSMRQFNAPALLAWGPELFGALEDRWGGVVVAVLWCGGGGQLWGSVCNVGGVRECALVE